MYGIMQSVDCVCALADGARLASGSYYKTIRIWNMSTGECLQVSPFDEMVMFNSNNLISLLFS